MPLATCCPHLVFFPVNNMQKACTASDFIVDLRARVLRANQKVTNTIAVEIARADIGTGLIELILTRPPPDEDDVNVYAIRFAKTTKPAP